MRPSIYKQKKTEELKKKSLILYKEGLSLRDVGKLIGRSHQWVKLALEEKGEKLSPVK